MLRTFARRRRCRSSPVNRAFKKSGAQVFCQFISDHARAQAPARSCHRAPRPGGRSSSRGKDLRGCPAPCWRRRMRQRRFHRSGCPALICPGSRRAQPLPHSQDNLPARAVSPYVGQLVTALCRWSISTFFSAKPAWSEPMVIFMSILVLLMYRVTTTPRSAT